MRDHPVTGFLYAQRGIRILTKPGLRRFVAVPLLVNCVVFGLGTWYIYQTYRSTIGWLLDWIPSWLHWLEWVIAPMFVVSLVLVLFFAFTLVANLLGAPFNGLLADRVEQLLSEQATTVPQHGDVKRILKEMLPAILDELGKVLHVVKWMIPIFFITAIPGINLLAPLIWTLFTAWFLAVGYLDFPMSNNRLKGREIRERIREKRLTVMGFGVGVLFMSSIPVLNLLAMPAAVAGATALWVEHFKEA
ncbi:MAG: sulfate transporter CysZ [Magnetococcales bacterium]|nr:sulfate transporter CysZ [Magnetococcales bacterium]MBF0322651.1 sulfate transporter CysZ [Magnetococcales bacterium]